MNTCHFLYIFFGDYGIKALLKMYSVDIFLSVKTRNTHVKRTIPHSMVTKKMNKQISSVHGSSVLTVILTM